LLSGEELLAVFGWIAVGRDATARVDSGRSTPRCDHEFEPDLSLSL
jgi:hypothetical protein